MEPREERGLVIAATVKLHHKGSNWIVPSQAGHGTYTVKLNGTVPTCSCPDYESRHQNCKHVYAVQFTVKREVNYDGSSQVTKTVKITYTQDWPAYTFAQTHEKERVAELLHGLCEGIIQPPQGRGRPRLPLSDMVFASVMKVYGTMSGRRSSTDIREFANKGYLDSAPHCNSIFHYLENPALKPILKALVEETATPLRAIETNFAVDSTGFSTSIYNRWYDKKYGKVVNKQVWIKAHLMCGVTTNIVTSVEITDGDANDSPFLEPLVNATANRFDINEVSADKGYISKKNLNVVVNVGAKPYIPFKENATGSGPVLWNRMWHYYNFKREDFLAHYHRRSNVESTYSMMKRKFGAYVRSKTFTAQTNEVLCKVICHNLCVLVSSMYELGISHFGRFFACTRNQAGRSILRQSPSAAAF